MILFSNTKRTVMEVGRARWHILDAEKGPCSPLWFLSLDPSTDKTDEGWIGLLQKVWTGKQMSSPRAVDWTRCPAGDPTNVSPRGGPQIWGYIPTESRQSCLQWSGYSIVRLSWSSEHLEHLWNYLHAYLFIHSELEAPPLPSICFSNLRTWQLALNTC